MSDRAARNLVNLENTASTARVLNLLAVWKAVGDTREWASAPFFHNYTLNRCLIIKHRLRRNETELFRSRRQIATKILVPMEATDLRLGGRFIFVDQIGFEASIRENFGIAAGDERDMTTLRLLDRLPSLDPFLLREQLKRYGVTPAQCYFELTSADLAKMVAFVEAEIRPLVAMSLGGDDQSSATSSLVSKILASAGGPEMEPLRMVLRLAADEYAEGIFCWKGFLYYKWALDDVLRDVAKVAGQIATIKPVGQVDSHSKAYIERGRRSLQQKIIATSETVTRTLKVYDDAYANLTQNGRPTAFREFLLEAPLLFSRLGEQVGAMQHIVSFWRYRFKDGGSNLGAEELMDILMDFETSLSSRGAEVTW